MTKLVQSSQVETIARIAQLIKHIDSCIII
jgi:hypothetical protein